MLCPRAGRSGNAALDGQRVVLTGSASPAPIGAGGDHLVYLVPGYGMCSHMPAPPVNNMVRFRLPRGEKDCKVRKVAEADRAAT